ncbi:unannotated protein [freshwater metagenome]|uniref:Unannotated protein n=1 Tax=freshwater metagenome TaxID=449393 RepID=A0A6J7EY49_9ZZZZ|nr:hypothetical protein [Actinomycetota bacterium]
MSSERELLRGALVPTLIVGVVALIASTVVKGSAGFFGALLAQAIVVIFFAAHLVVAKLTRDADPMTTMALAMASYFVKLFIFGGFLLLVTRLVPVENCNRTAFGISAISATFAWLGGEIATYLKLKTHLQLPKS